jgi:hypothetical protein
MRRAVLLAALALAFGASASAAGARSHPIQTAVQDGAAIFDRPTAPLAMARIRAAGASWVRLDVQWRGVAPPGSSKPPGFDASSPGDPLYDWGGVDFAVREAVANGLSPFISIAEAPSWAERGSGGRSGTQNPDPGELAAFARAAALRYSGHYAGLPRVSAWEVWNEVNASFFFAPQWQDTPGARKALSPVLYRKMVNDFAAAVHGVDTTNVVVAGSLYPFALDRPTGQAIPPLEFLRDFFCLTKKLRVISGCGEPVHMDVLSHHPYTSGDPLHEVLAPDSVSIGQLPRMARVLRAAVRQGRVISRRPVGFWVTEFGWDTNPPDPQGVPVALQARWISESLYRMWNAGVSVASWFKLRDGYGDNSRFASGLFSICPQDPANVGCDRPKLSFDSFRFPFVAFRRKHRRIYVWGRTPGSVPGKVIVEQRRHGRFRRVVKLKTNRWGVFGRTLRSRKVKRSHGNLRARLAGGSVASLPFSLKRPPDFPISPPVG